MSRVQHWVNPAVFRTLTQAQMQAHRERGISGYVLGGPQWPWSRTAPATTNGPLKPGIDLSHAVEMEDMLGVTVTHRTNCSTPLAPWFDGGNVKGGGPKWEYDYEDGPEMRLSIKTMLQAQLRAMRDAGSDELWIDGEEYSGRPAQVAFNDAQREGSDQFLGTNGRWSWRWDYLADNYPSTIGYPHLSIPANTHTEAETRAQVRMRGEQFIAWILEVWPGVHIASDYNRFEGGEWDRQWHMSHDEPNPFWTRGVQKDFWGGILSNPGIGRFRHLERGFYRSRRADLMETNRVNLRKVYLSLVPADQRARLHEIMFIEPMIWLDPSNTTEHPYPGDAQNLEHCVNAGSKCEHTVAVYAHKAFSATQYNDSQIYAATKAAGEQTPATIPPYEEPDPVPPTPVDCSACEGALLDCQVALAAEQAHVDELEAELEVRAAEAQQLRERLDAIRGALAVLAAEANGGT